MTCSNWRQDYVTIGEVGSFNLSLNRNTSFVPFSRRYLNPVVIAEPLSRYGTDVAVIRITEVTSTGFSLFIQEAPNQNQLNIKESSSYIVLEEGIWNLYNGVHLE